MKPFYVPVESVEEGVKILNVLAQYDLFQFENRIKPDYCNVGGLQRYVAVSDDKLCWEDWYDEETGEDDPRAWLEQRQS
jgi:hypothetical protein